jgi:hypothetical protein
MREDACGDYLDIYCKNENVQMIILKKDGYLVGRAILWDNKWVDRIYGIDSTIKAFRNYAKEKGFHCKSSQNSDPCQGWIHPETGASYGETVTIELNTEWERYPYADTFAYIDVKGGKISTDTRDLTSYCEMRDTCGGLEGDDNVYDEYDDRNIHVDDAVYLESRNYYTHERNAGYCDVNSEYYLNDDLVETHDGRTVCEEESTYVDTAGTYAVHDDVFHCEQSDKDYIEGYDGAECVHLSEIGMTVMNDYVEEAYADNDYVNVDNEWQSKDDLISNGYTEDYGVWSLSDDESQTV